MSEISKILGRIYDELDGLNPESDATDREIIRAKDSILAAHSNEERIARQQHRQVSQHTPRFNNPNFTGEKE